MCLVLAALLCREYNLTVYIDANFEMAGVTVEPISEIVHLTADDILIFAVTNFDERIDNCKARLIAWAHNLRDNKLDYLSNRVDRLIVLSRAQYDLLRWHKISDKMSIIPLPFNVKAFEYSPSFDDYIVYMGALVEAKGFHIYASAVDKILSGRTTKMFVIGGTQTYGQSGAGKLGVTTQEYEDRFYQWTDKYVKCGQIEFLGNLGTNRFEIMSKAKLGLTNPTGSSETFCISNFEFMALGVPVLGGYHKGMTETLFPDAKLYFRNIGEIGAKVTRLLDDPELLKRLRPTVRAYVERKAKLGAVTEGWRQIIAGDRPRKPLFVSRPYFIDSKLPIYFLSKCGVRTTFEQVDKVVRSIARLSIQ